MIVTFVSQCEKKALARTRRVLDAFADRIENGEHTAKPAFRNERHIHFFCRFRYNFLCLFFSSDEHDFLSGFGNLFQRS